MRGLIPDERDVGKIKDDPGSEEQQGKNLVDAAIKTGTVECLLWSTLPSSKQISGGKYVSRIYEGMCVCVCVTLLVWP